MMETLISNIQSTINEQPLVMVITVFLSAFTIYMFASNYIQRAKLKRKMAVIQKQKLELESIRKELEAGIIKKRDDILNKLKGGR